MSRIMMLGLLVAFLASSALAVEFTNFRGLTDEEVIIHSTGKREMRMNDDAVQQVKEWEFVGADGKPDPTKQAELFDFIAENRRTSYTTLVHPLFAAGLVEKDKLITRSYSGRINGLQIGPDSTDEALEAFQSAAGIEAGTSAAEIKKGSDAYQFKNVVINYYFQKKPNRKSGSQRAEWGSGQFNERYEKVVRTIGDYTLKSDVKNPPYSPPGDVAFDVGVNDDNNEQPLEASQSADTEVGEVDYTCEVFVELTGEVWKNGALSTKFEDMADAPIGRSTVYVEDYVPPLPEELGSLEVQTNAAALQPQGDSNGNSFVPGMGRFYQNDGSAVASNLNAESTPVEMYYWPNADAVDRDNDGVNDYGWQNIQMKNNNDADLAVNNTFNYEVGSSLYQRVKYKDDPNAYDQPGGWKYIYYVPYRPINGEYWGPYCGRVHSASADMNGFDKYDIDNEGGETFDLYYRPIVLPDAVTFNSTEYKPKGLVDEVYGMGDAAVEVQQKSAQLQTRYGFRHVAGISVKWGRECVQGITVGNTGQPELKIPEGTMLLPTGFSSAKVAKNGGAFKVDVDRLGSFDAEFDNSSDPNVPQSLMGTPKEGTDARDSFFKVNAADCCNNDVVIASGTYGSEDNLKPIPKLVIEEMDSHDNSGGLYLDVATVPNDLSGAGNPMGQYNPDKVYSKLHTSQLPLYGTGVQGQDIRGYGNFSNNASTWNGLMEPKSLQNPVDNTNNFPYLAVRYYNNEPAFEEDRRYQVTITGDDNIGPTVDTATGTIYYPIRHLSYVFYYHPTAQTVAEAPAGCKQVVTGNADAVRETVSQQMEAAGFRVVDRGAAIDVDINAPATEWAKEPSTTFEYKFKSPGLWVVRVDAIDRSNNGRVMLVPLNVGNVAMKTRTIDQDQRRLD